MLTLHLDAVHIGWIWIGCGCSLFLRIHLLRATLIITIEKLDTEGQHIIRAAFDNSWSCLSIIARVYIRLILSRATIAFRSCCEVMAFEQVTLLIYQIRTHLTREELCLIAISIRLGVVWSTFNLWRSDLIVPQPRRLLISRWLYNIFKESTRGTTLHAN